ncbi:MAG: hypothetical protein ACK5L5_05685 [Bacteroidales bacterium]
MIKTIRILICIAIVMLTCQRALAQSRNNNDTINKQAAKTAMFKTLYIDALKYKMLGVGEKSLKNLADCLEIDSTSSAVMQQLGVMHLMAKDLDAAETYFANAVEHNPDNKQYVSDLIRFYTLIKKPIKAARTYDKLPFASKDEDLRNKLRQANLYMQGKDLEAAETVLNELSKEDTELVEVVLTKASLYSIMDDGKKAEKYLEKKLNKDPKNVKYLEGLMNIYSQKNDEEKFIETSKRILAIEPGHPDVCYWLSGYYADKKEYDKSVEYSLSVINNPNIPYELKLNLAQAFVSKQDERNISGASHFSGKQQETIVNNLIESEPQEAGGYSLLATLHINNSKLPEAEKALKKSLDIDQSNYVDWGRLLLIYNEQQEMDELEETAVRVNELFPSQPLPILFKAFAMYEKKNYQGLLDMLDAEMDLFVDVEMKSQAMMLKAGSYESLGEIEKSYAQYESILKFSPNDILALNNYAYLISENGGDLRKAEKMSAKTIERDPRNSTFLDTYAWVLFKQKEYSLAKYYIESCVENLKKGEESGVIYEHYGDILYMNGDVDKALNQWKTAKELGGEVSENLDDKISTGKILEK